MFRLSRHRSEKSGERIDFKFSHFQAVQVPKGWDKLFVSITSVETGKTVAKSSKAVVRNGNCQWKEALTESIWVSQDDVSKEHEECLFKFVIAMGSARSGILGEAIYNLTECMSSRTSVTVSLPLKKCSYGTILHVKIQCLTPRTSSRGEKHSRERTSSQDDLNIDDDNMENRSDGSDNMFARSVGSSSSNHLGGSFNPGESRSRELSFSASGSHYSSDSGEGSIGRTNFSPTNNFHENGYNLIGRQESTGSQNSAGDDPKSNRSSFSAKSMGAGLQYQLQDVTGQTSPQVLVPVLLKTPNSSKDLLEVAEYTIEELRAEAKMWERNSRKLKLDLETLRKEFSDQARRQADQDMELSAAYTERDGLKMEIEQLRVLLEGSMVKQSASHNSTLTQEDIIHIQEELEDEIRFQKESNANLALQLKKTQDSNIELVSVLQELEETIEKQKLEIIYLSAQKPEVNGVENLKNENSGPMHLIDSVGNTRESSRIDIVYVEEMDHLHEQARTNGNLSLEMQLQELQESQRKMQSVVQFLEKNLEEKNREMENERVLRNKTLLDIEAEWSHKLSIKEEEISKLEAKLTDSVSGPCSHEMRFLSSSDPDLIKEIEFLKAKVEELEKDCNELTDENLELILKMKSLKKEVITGDTSLGPASKEVITAVSISETKTRQLKSEISELEVEQKEKEGLSEDVTDQVHAQLVDIQNKCTGLELELQSFKDIASNLNVELCQTHIEMEKKKMELTTLEQQVESCRHREIEWQEELTVARTKIHKFESYKPKEMPEISSEICKQLQLALANVKKPWYDSEYEYGLDLTETDSTRPYTQEEQTEAIIANLLELNNLLEAKILKCKATFEHRELQVRKIDAHATDSQKQLTHYISKGDGVYLSLQELERSNLELQSKIGDMSKELSEKISEINELSAFLSLKEEEVLALKLSQKELEAEVSKLQTEKSQLELNLETTLKESSIASKCLDDVRQELVVLTCNMDSQASVTKMLERKSGELESGKRELEFHLSEVEEENVQLSERISGLEAQLRYFTDERESSRMEMENSRCLVTDLQSEITRLQAEIDMQRLELKQKLQETQKHWSEAQEELEVLKRANSKLQTTVASLIEECNSLQKLNEELRRQRLELHDHSTHLDKELRESQKQFSDCYKKVESLEMKLSSMHRDVVSKEKSLASELADLLKRHKENDEKLTATEDLLNRVQLEKTVEVENLQREVAHLTAQISSTHDERERIASDAVLEVSSLRADKTKMENSLQEALDKVRFYEAEIDTIRVESVNKVQELVSKLSVSKQNEEILIAEHEHIQRSVEDIKANEEKSKQMVNKLELKLNTSEFSKKQLMEEIASLKVQLQTIAKLQEEILSLKSRLDETTFEKRKLESSLQLLSEDCEELKLERLSCVEKISSMQKVLSEAEDARRNRVALEEKILRLECDLSAREALCAHDAELKNEVNRVKRANNQFQRKIQCLEEEKDECLRRTEALEKKLKMKKEDKTWDGKQVVSETGMNGKENQCQEVETQLSMEQSWEYSEGRRVFAVDQNKKQDNNQVHGHNDRNTSEAVDLMSKVKVLETKLAEALDANDMYKTQLKGFLSEDQNIQGNAIEKRIEVELRDMRERYFQMSLRYAEVEAEREELVMKVKALSNGKRWFR